MVAGGRGGAGERGAGRAGRAAVAFGGQRGSWYLIFGSAIWKRVRLAVRRASSPYRGKGRGWRAQVVVGSIPRARSATIELIDPFWDRWLGSNFERA